MGQKDTHFDMISCLAKFKDNKFFLLRIFINVYQIKKRFIHPEIYRISFFAYFALYLNIAILLKKIFHLIFPFKIVRLYLISLGSGKLTFFSVN